METDDYFIIKVKKGDTLSHLAKRSIRIVVNLRLSTRRI